MSITFPLDQPGYSDSIRTSVPGYQSQDWTYQKIVALSRSIFTGSIQVQEFQGEWLECVITLPAMPREKAEPWAAFLGSLRGPVGSFMLGDSLSIVHGIRGVLLTGQPLIKGAAQVGKIVNTDGWTGTLKAGDWIAFAGSSGKWHLYKVMADVTSSDATATTAIDIFPQLLDPTVDNNGIAFGHGQGQFKMLNPGTYGYDVAQICKGLTFTAVQDI